MINKSNVIENTNIRTVKETITGIFREKNHLILLTPVLLAMDNLPLSPSFFPAVA